MALKPWDVLRCPDCGQTFGRRQGSKPKCIRCGREGEDGVIVVGDAENVQQLQHIIAMKNVPEELFAKLSKMVSYDEVEKPESIEKQSPKLALKALRVACNENDEIDNKSLKIAIERNRFSADAEEEEFERPETPHEMILSRVQHMVRDRPEDAAKLIRTMLVEENT